MNQYCNCTVGVMLALSPVTEIAKSILLSCQMKTCGVVECGLKSVRICESECPRVGFRPPAGQNNTLAVKINCIWGHPEDIRGVGYGPLCPQPPRGAPHPGPPENKQTRGRQLLSERESKCDNCLMTKSSSSPPRRPSQSPPWITFPGFET